MDAKTTRPQQELPLELPPELDLCTGKIPAAPPETPDDEQILVAVATNSQSAADIARQAGISILELARIVTTPRNLEDLQRVTQLHAIEREMMLGPLKRKALVRLGELTDEVGAMNANEVRACEVMRKACVDILRSGNDVMKKEGQSSRPRPTDKHRHSLTPASETEILEALEKWGGKIEEQEEEYPQIAQMGRSGVRGAEVTDEVQVGMAFGKTSDHGTGKTSDHVTATDRTRTRRVPPLERADKRTGGAPGVLDACMGIESRNSADAGRIRFDDAHPP